MRPRNKHDKSMMMLVQFIKIFKNMLKKSKKDVNFRDMWVEVRQILGYIVTTIIKKHIDFILHSSLKCHILS